MPFHSGEPKPPGSGRKAGTSNKVSKEVAERLAELGCDPIEGMAMLALDPKNPPELRGRMFAELAQYCYNKRKSMEVCGPNGGPIQAHLLTLEDLDRIIDQSDAEGGAG
jgi:hypothetical protein